ncbi:hypothetical protein BHM03_00015837 [Ensete ventricosum]|nr:hypothetical protein BHM03_00015837 [Ensete ventricosum]
MWYVETTAFNRLRVDHPIITLYADGSPTTINDAINVLDFSSSPNVIGIVQELLYLRYSGSYQRSLMPLSLTILSYASTSFVVLAAWPIFAISPTLPSCFCPHLEIEAELSHVDIRTKELLEATLHLRLSFLSFSFSFASSSNWFEGRHGGGRAKAVHLRGTGCGLTRKLGVWRALNLPSEGRRDVGAGVFIQPILEKNCFSPCWTFSLVNSSLLRR